MALLTAALLVPELGAAPAGAQVIMKRSPDGGILLVNRTKKRPRSRARVRPVAPSAELGALIDRYARDQGLDPMLVRAVVQIESAYDPRALSHKGAMGLMQLMPETARDLGVGDPWNVRQNLSGGTRYLRAMIDRFGGRLELGLAAYNAGPSAVERYGRIPPYEETTNYVDKVLTLYRGGGIIGPVTSRQPGTPKPRPTRPVLIKRDSNNRIVLVTP